MPRPLIPVEAIYERALALLDAEGADALSVVVVATALTGGATTCVSGVEALGE